MNSIMHFHNHPMLWNEWKRKLYMLVLITKTLGGFWSMKRTIHSICVTAIYSSVQSDGYHWGYGNYNGVYGYFQYDPNVMYLFTD